MDPNAANLGYTRDIVWTRIIVLSKSDAPSPCFAQLSSSRIENAEWFVTGDGRLLKHHSGGSMAHVQNAEEFRLRQPTVEFNLPAKAERIRY